jgi:hypothetical protein
MLLQELERYRTEKDRIRRVLGQIGGLPHFLSTQLALFLVSLKIVWMIHRQTRVDHFQFWILHSIEFQINLITQRLQAVESAIPRRRDGGGQGGRGKARRPAGGSRGPGGR